jgi:5-methylcytosine-specific restriction endonuclease McrA
MFQSLDRIYKLKITGIIADPIYYMCTSKEIVNDIVENIKTKYKNCANGTFTFKSMELDLFTPLDKYNFSVGCFAINEVTFTPNTKAKEISIESAEPVKSTVKSVIEKKPRKTKERIPKSLKDTLWKVHFGENVNGFCYCCKLAPIQITNFDCGHIVSEKKGGTVHLDNLKPICRTCNSSMSTMNMEDYIKKYGFDKIKN